MTDCRRSPRARATMSDRGRFKEGSENEITCPRCLVHPGDLRFGVRKPGFRSGADLAKQLSRIASLISVPFHLGVSQRRQSRLVECLLYSFRRLKLPVRFRPPKSRQAATHFEMNSAASR